MIATYSKNGVYTGFLGNIMFQTAATIGIAVKNNLEYCFPHKAEFDYFCGKIPTAWMQDLDADNYQEVGFHYSDVILDPNRNHNLNGYFQSGKYFEHCESLIREVFTFNDTISRKCQETIKQIRQTHHQKRLVSIHFRFGDYLKLKDLHTCLIDTDYYEKAIQYLFSDCNMEYHQLLDEYRHTSDNAKMPQLLFIVFSDDKAMAEQYMDKMKNEFIDLEYIIINNTSAPEDMCLQSLCDYNVIANSSFSWWGAWLNKSARTVYAPGKDKWFSGEYKNWKLDDLYMPNWILI